MASTKPTMGQVLDDLKDYNANQQVNEKQNIIVVQDTRAGSEDKTGQMLTVLNSIFNAVSEQLRLTRESLNLQKEDRLSTKDFQKESMDVSSGRYEPPQYNGSGGGGGSASSEGGGGGILGTAARVGGGLVEGAKGIGRTIAGVAARHPLGAAVVGGAAAGLGIGGAYHIADKIKTSKGKDKLMVQTYDAFRNAGFSDKQSRSLIGEVGRENSFRPEVIFGTHKDLNKSAGTNVGFFSWNRERKDALLKQLADKGLYKGGKIIQGQESLNTMAEFAMHEMRTTHKRVGSEFLSDPNIDPLRARELMGGKRGYIGWARGQTSVRGTPFDWKSHENRIIQHYGRISELLKDKNLSPDKDAKTLTKLTSNDNQPNIQPTATKMVDTSDLRVKGGLRGQAFKGGETEQGIVNLARTIQADEANIPGGLNRFSSFNDAYHLKANPKSKHTQGLAMDFSLKNSKYSSEATNYIKQKLLSSGMTEEDFKIINEYKRPSKHATGGHIHVNFANKQAAEKFAQYSSGEGRQTRLASNEEQLPKTGRHQLERTDEKSGVLQASMFAPLQTAFDRMSRLLEKIEGNTKDTKEEIKDKKSSEEGTDKASKANEEESPTATKTDEEPETPNIYKAKDFLSEDDKKIYDQAEKKALDESLKTGKKEITEDDVMRHMSDDDKAKYGKAKEDAKAASLAESNATRMEPENQVNDALTNLPNNEGSDVMKMLFGQGGAIMGSAEPIEPGSPKRQFLDSLPSYGDKLSEYVKKLINGEGEVSEEDLQGAIQAMSESDTSGVMGGLLGMGGGTTTQQTPISATPTSGTEQFLNGLGITPYNNQQESQLNAQKSNQLSNMGVSPFGGGFGSNGNIFNQSGGGMGGMGGFGNNPFYAMQGVLSQVGSMANMGQNIGGMMQQGGLGGIQGVMNGAGGILSSMGQGFPMAQGIGGMLGQAGNMIGAVRGFENIGRGGFGGMGGMMGGMNAASGVLGSLGNVFGMMGGGSGGMMGGGLGNYGVNPFGGGFGGMGGMMGGGLGGIMNGIGGMMGGMGGMMSGGFGGMGGGINAASGMMSAGGGLMDTATSLGSSIGGMLGGIGDSIGGLFGGGGDSSSQKGGDVSSMGIGDDAASIANKYSDLTMNQTGAGLGSAQSSNDSLSSMPSGGSSGQPSGTVGRNGAAPADAGSMGSSMGASGGAGFKSGDKRAGSSSGAMGSSMNPYNNCNVLFQWLYRNMWWAKV